MRKYYTEFRINAFNNHWTISQVPLSKASYERDTFYIHLRDIFFPYFFFKKYLFKRVTEKAQHWHPRDATLWNSSWSPTKYQFNVVCPECFFIKPRLYLRNDANFELCYEINSNLMQFTLYNPRTCFIIWWKNRTLTQFLQFHYYLMTQQQFSYLRNDISFSYESPKWSIEWRGSHVNGWRRGKIFFFI